MNLKLKEIDEALLAFKYLMDKEIKTSYIHDILKNIENCEKEIKLFIDTRNQLVEKYGELNKNNEKEIKETNPQFTKFNNEINELYFSKDIEVNIILIDKEVMDSQISFKPIFYKTLLKYCK